MSLKPPLQLTELELRCPLYDVDKIWAYLSSAPSLTHLTIRTDSMSLRSYTRRKLPVNTSFLPNLCVLKCPLSLAISFAKLPMKKLIITTFYTSASVSSAYFKPRVVDPMVAGLDGVVFATVAELATVPAEIRGLLPPSTVKTSFPRLGAMVTCIDSVSATAKEPSMA